MACYIATSHFKVLLFVQTCFTVGVKNYHSFHLSTPASDFDFVIFSCYIFLGFGLTVNSLL